MYIRRSHTDEEGRIENQFKKKLTETGGIIIKRKEV